MPPPSVFVVPQAELRRAVGLPAPVLGSVHPGHLVCISDVRL